MSADTNKEIVRRLGVEPWEGKLGVIDELVAPDYVGHDPAQPEMHGPEGIKEFITGYLAGFPDGRITIDGQLAEGDMVATRWTGRPGYPVRTMVGMALAKSLYTLPTWTRTVALVREHAALRGDATEVGLDVFRGKRPLGTCRHKAQVVINRPVERHQASGLPADYTTLSAE